MKLTDIKIRSILLEATDEDISKIVFKDNSLEIPSDIGIILGGPSLYKRAAAGASLYQEGLVKKLIASGGIGYLNKDRNNPEAFLIRDYLLNAGIPGSDIISEPISKNTFENIINILSILNNIYDINNTSFTIITSDFHLKRSTAILAEILGKDVQGIGIEDGITDNKNWTNTQIGRIQILKEALLLINSARRKEIEDLEVGTLSLKRKKHKNLHF